VNYTLKESSTNNPFGFLPRETAKYNWPFLISSLYKQISGKVPFLKDIYEEEKHHPNHINKVPVPGCHFETKMIILGKVTLE